MIELTKAQLNFIIIALCLLGILTGATMQSAWDNHKLKDLIVILKEKGCI